MFSTLRRALKLVLSPASRRRGRRLQRPLAADVQVLDVRRLLSGNAIVISLGVTPDHEILLHPNLLSAPAIATNPVNEFVKAGAMATFTASASGNPVPTVQWQRCPNGGTTYVNLIGATSTTYSVTTVAALNGYKYRAVFTNSQGSATTTGATLTVLTIPAVTTNPVSQTITAGLSVSFTSAASGNPAPSVQWQRSTDGGTTYVNLIGATSTTYTVTTVAALNGYKYRAVFTNSQGSATTTAATLTVATAPAVTTNPLSQSIKSGLSVSFTAAASGNPAPTVQWQRSTDGGTTYLNLIGATSTTYTVTTMTTLNGFKYRAVFTNSQGSATTTAATLTIVAAPVVTTNPTNKSVKAGLTATFTAAASGNPAPTVQWQLSTNSGTTFTNIAGATSTTYSFTVAASQNGNQYRAVFTNSQGSATTTAAILSMPLTSSVLHNFGNLGLGGVVYQLGSGPNGSEFFEVSVPSTGDVQLWISNGSTSGTILLHDFGNLGNAGVLDALQQLGTGSGVSLVFMSVDFTTMDTQLWGSNGTVAGTSKLHDFGNLGTGGVLSSFDVVGTGASSYVLLQTLDSTTNDTQLWGSNATLSGTSLLHDFGNLQATGGIAVEGKGSNGSVLFDSNQSTTGDTQLWATSGIASGTIMLHDFGDLGNNTTFLSGLETAENGSLLLQSSNDSTGDNQLWASSGTVAGTIMLHDYGDLAAPDTGSTGNLNIIGRVSNGIVLLEAFNSVSTETQLWATDGTVVGTILIQDLGERGLNNNLLLGLGNAPTGSVLFSALNTANDAYRVWQSNGTVVGTTIMHSYGNLGTAGFISGLETASNGTRMIVISNSTTGDEQLWTSDGTVAGTIQLKDFGNLGTNDLGIDAVSIVGTGSNVSGLFQTFNSITGDDQLWVSHGTVASTVMLRDFGDTPSGGILSDLTAGVSGVELLEWNDPTTSNVQLWGTNGTIAGTIELHKFDNFGTGSGTIFYLSTGSNGFALLEFNDFSLNDTQLWASDGTVATTSLLRDFGTRNLTPVINEGTGTNVGGLFSSVQTSTKDVQLWDTDGTFLGTVMAFDSGVTYSTLTFTEDGVGLFGIATVTANGDTELLWISP